MRLPIPILAPALSLLPAFPTNAQLPLAELVWPDDPRARLLEAEAAPAGGRVAVAWPQPAGDICTGDSAASDKSASSVPLYAEACRDSRPRGPFRATGTLGSYADRLARPWWEPFEAFDAAWGSVSLDPELARDWSRLPPLLSLELRHAFSHRVFASFRMGLRRDLDAWRKDDLAHNLPLSTKEVDLNEPSLGYLSYAGDWLEVVIGRFPLHWSPSPEFGLALSHATPHHNAVQAVLKGSRLRYRFLVSSLNPWLEGTPLGRTSGTEYPVGSEEWQQRNYPIRPGSENAHRRVYDARVKTFLAHRLESWAGPFTFGLTETHVVGGKVPDLRDANPFAVFHNDFHEGYSNNNVSIDILARLPQGFSLGGEVFMDDLEWSETEGRGGSPSLLGYMAFLRHSTHARGWTLAQSLHAVFTDPFLYGFLQPLNTYSSRHVLTSNHQEDGAAVFVDKFVVDYPLGYLRGGDAMDFWYRLEGWRGPNFGVSLSLAFLSKGEVDGRTPYERSYLTHGSSPSGVPEEELRFHVSAWRRLGHGLEVEGGLGLRRMANIGHIEGKDDLFPAATLGLAWRHPN